MQLLTEVMDVNELMRLRMLYESNGIAVHVSNEDSARNFGFVYPARKYGIFVVYENQYEDATALLEDENHVVKHPINLDEYRAFSEKHAPESTKKLFNVIMNITLVMGVVIAALVTYLVITDA